MPADFPASDGDERGSRLKNEKSIQVIRNNIIYYQYVILVREGNRIGVNHRRRIS